MASSVVQTNRAVYAESEISTLSQSTPCDITAEHADRERHVACDAAAVDDQIVDEEAQRHLLQMIRQELLREPTWKTHEMVGRNRSGHRNGHETSPFIY